MKLRIHTMGLMRGSFDRSIYPGIDTFRVVFNGREEFDFITLVDYLRWRI